MDKRRAGFTLLQLMVCLSILALLAVVAMPAWRGAIAATHAAGARAALTRSLATAITHTGITGSEIVLCPSTAGDCAAGWDWSAGWIAFADRDGDRHRDSSEQVVARVGPLGGGIRLFTSSGRQRIVIQPNAGNAGSNATFTLCAEGRVATQLILANTGQLRVARLDEEESGACAR